MSHWSCLTSMFISHSPSQCMAAWSITQRKLLPPPPPPHPKNPTPWLHDWSLPLRNSKMLLWTNKENFEMFLKSSQRYLCPKERIMNTSEEMGNLTARHHRGGNRNPMFIKASHTMVPR